MNQLTAYFSSASRKGTIGAGILLVSEGGTRVGRVSRSLGLGTVAEAPWLVLVEAARLVAKHSPEAVAFLTENVRLVAQATGRTAVPPAQLLAADEFRVRCRHFAWTIDAVKENPARPLALDALAYLDRPRLRGTYISPATAGILRSIPEEFDAERMAPHWIAVADSLTRTFEPSGVRPKDDAFLFDLRRQLEAGNELSPRQAKVVLRISRRQLGEAA